MLRACDTGAGLVMLQIRGVFQSSSGGMGKRFHRVCMTGLQR